MLTHIKTHIQFHLSQRQFRLLLLLLTISSEYTFLVTPGTFANGVEQILSATGTTVSQTRTANLTSQTKEKRLTYSIASRPSSVFSKEEKNTSNVDGWIASPDETPGSWITFEKKTTNQTSQKTTNQTSQTNSSTKFTATQTPSNALPQSFSAAPSVPTYNPNYLYPTTPISETAYTIATSYPSGNPGKTVNSTSDVPEGTNLYYTEARVQSAFELSFSGKTTDALREGLTNLYYTTARFVADFTARFQSAFDSAFSNKTTDNLAE